MGNVGTHAIVREMEVSECGVAIRIFSYSKTSEERTLWDRGLCPLFRGCPPLGGCPFFTSKPYSVC